MTILPQIDPALVAGSEIAGPDMGRSYDSYFATGLYKRRYPGPNRRVLARAERLIPRGGRFLDYGVGDGRYCVPLVRRRAATAIAFDISAGALAALEANSGPLVEEGRIRPVGTHLRDLEVEIARSGPVDLVLAAFGVLGHVRGRRQRVALLQSFRTMLKPGGRVLVGLPNARRRFRREQHLCSPEVGAGRLERGDILYSRSSGDERIELYYHLYDADEVRAEAGAAGFTIDEMTAESLLPERAVVSRPLLGRLDDLACAIAPVGLAYGFLVTLSPR